MEKGLGIDAPIAVREQGLQPYGAHPTSEGEPKKFRQTTSGARGSAGRTDWMPDVPTRYRLGLAVMGFSPASVPEGFQRASGKPFGAPVGAYPCPRRGLTRRLRRGRWVCRPEEGSTFFRRERKYQRKQAARRLREKALYCPFLKEGVRNVARSIVE